MLEENLTKPMWSSASPRLASCKAVNDSRRALLTSSIPLGILPEVSVTKTIAALLYEIVFSKFADREIRDLQDGMSKIAVSPLEKLALSPFGKFKIAVE